MTESDPLWKHLYIVGNSQSFYFQTLGDPTVRAFIACNHSRDKCKTMTKSHFVARLPRIGTKSPID